MNERNGGTGGEASDSLAPRHAAPGRTGYDRAPLVVTWEVTRACDLACLHCRASAQPGRQPGELSTEEGKRLLERLRGFGDPPPVVVFTGGDPLKRPDLLELVRHGTSVGLPIGVTPASTPLLTRPTLEAFRDAGVRRVALSLDGATPERHDGFRGERGSFGIIRRAAREAADLGLSLQINTTVTRDTAEDLPAIAERVEAMGAVMWEVFFLVPVGRGAELEALTPEAHERVLEWLYRRSREAPFRIITVEAPFYRRVGRQIELREGGAGAASARGAGRRGSARGTGGSGAPAARGHGGRRPHGSTGDGNGFLFIGRLGEIHPSGFLPLEAGNVRTHDVVRVYRESPLFRALRDRDRLKGKCGACSFRFLCGGSRARAHALTGDPLAADPFCPYVPEGWEEEARRPRPKLSARRSLPLTGA